MPIRYVIRPPSIMTTPRRLANAIEQLQNSRCTTLRGDLERIPNRSGVSSIINLYPSSSMGIESFPDILRAFYRKTKAEQRKSLQAAGIPTVPCATSHNEAERLISPTGKFVTRPLRHSQGRGWRLTSNPLDFNPGTEYVQVLVHKRREFRAIFCCGSRLFLLRKSNPGNLSADQPWNHSEGSVFVTIRDERNNFLLNSPILGLLDNYDILQRSHLCGVDIIQDYHDQAYVLEFNACPSLAIEANLQEVAAKMVSTFNH